MGPKKVAEKSTDNAQLLSEIEELRERLCAANGEIENAKSQSETLFRENRELEGRSNHLLSLFGDSENVLSMEHEGFRKDLQNIQSNQDAMLKKMREEMDRLRRELSLERASRHESSSLQRDNVVSPGSSIHAASMPSLVHFQTPMPTINQPRQVVRDVSPTRYSIPLPQLRLYDGTGSYDSFIKQFISVAESCMWDQNEKAFRLLSSLRGEAADFVFSQIAEDLHSSFYALDDALSLRFK